VVANAAALSQLQLAWLLMRRMTWRGAPDPGGSAAAWLGEVTGVPRDRIGRAHGVPAIRCGPPCTWAGM
jgi:hypothetical protein